MKTLRRSVSTGLVWLLLLALPACALDQTRVSTNSIELLRDAEFRNGFKIAAPKSGQKIVTGMMRPQSAEGKPDWYICQWHSKYDLSDGKVEQLDDETIYQFDKSKSVTISSSNSLDDLILSLDSNHEYGKKMRKKNQSWPHLLVQQDKLSIYLLKGVDRVELSVDAKLLKNESLRHKGYSRNLHTAQFVLTFVVQNRNKLSKGFGDMIWFNVMMYDERSRFPDLYAAKDTADPSAKMIYAPPSKTFSKDTLHDGDWVTFYHKDLTELFREGLALARKRGYLRTSPSDDDFAINSVVLGWEVTGVNDVSMRVKDLKIRVYKKTD